MTGPSPEELRDLLRETAFDVSERYFEPDADGADPSWPAPRDTCSGERSWPDEPDTGDATAQPNVAAEGAELLDVLAAFVRRYVVMTREQADAVAFWIAHTYAFDAAEATPYLAISSPEKRSGKSRLLEVLDLLVAKPLRAAGTTEAALFRSIAERKPTLLIDEADAIFRSKGSDGREDLRALLNAGYRRGAPILRCVGDGSRQRVEEFDAFCPKALAGIGRLPETVADRSIPLTLKRRAPEERIERFRQREAADAAEPLRALAAGWAQANVDALAAARPLIPWELDDRAADGWEPLLAIADLVGRDWPERARRAALALSAGEEREDDSFGVRLLADVRRAFDAAESDRLATSVLIEVLAADEEAPWGDWRRSGHITPRALASLLSRYRVRSRTIRLDSGKTPKGYLREQFEDVWNRYLPLDGGSIRHNVTTRTVEPKTADFAPPQDSRVAESETGADPHGYAVAADVADRKFEKGNGRVPLPGDEGFRGFLNAAYEAGHVTHRERHARRLLHDRIVRARLLGEAAS